MSQFKKDHSWGKGQSWNACLADTIIMVQLGKSRSHMIQTVNPKWLKVWVERRCEGEGDLVVDSDGELWEVWRVGHRRDESSWVLVLVDTGEQIMIGGRGC